MDYTFEGAGELQHHKVVSLEGRPTRTEEAAFSPWVHALHYATAIISGVGLWQCADGQHRGFRWLDHIQRFLANMQAMGHEPEKIPSVREVMQAMVALAQLNFKDLTQAPDLYLRLFGFEAGEELGVNSRDRMVWAIISRDLTDYLGAEATESGISLLFPRELFRRTTPYCGLPHLKATPNYSLGAWWKGIVAPQYNCKEVLALTCTGNNLCETTGSNVFLVKGGQIWTPKLSDWPLPGWTRDTVIQLARAMDICVEDGASVLATRLTSADEVFITGTWSGVVPVTGIMAYNGEMPSPDVFLGNGGYTYQQWVDEHFNPAPIDAPFSQVGQPGPITRQLMEAYWAVVRHDLDNVPPGFDIPADWHNKVDLT